MSQSSNTRIAKSSIVLYLRTMIIMIITLYTSRIVLNSLGIDDFGVYNAVGGFIAMFGLISNSLSSAISRYLTFELGKTNIPRLKEIFSSSLIMLSIIGLVIILLIETGGVWFLNSKMDIPANSVRGANWVLQFSAITFLLNLLNVPYNAAIIAQEKMKAFAYISILDTLGKLGVAVSISYSTSERLSLYSGLLCLWALIIRLIYAAYCHKKFTYCKLEFRINKGISKEIFAFSGWNFIGASASVLKDQGVNVLINIFCGPAVNAGRGIAMQVNHAIQNFTNSFTTALNPQITKQYAVGNWPECLHLVFRGSKFSCFLLLFLAIPIFLESDFILKIWLKTIPPYAVIFVRLIILNVLIDTISFALITLMLAIGKIRNYQIIVGGVLLLNFPICWIILRNGISPEYTVLVAIIISLCCLCVRLIMLSRMISFSISKFFSEVVLKVVAVTLTSSSAPLLTFFYMEQGWFKLVVITLISFISTTLFAYRLGCSQSERIAIRSKFTAFINHLF